MGQIETLDYVKNDIHRENLIDEKKENAMREYVRNKMESVQKKIDELKKAKDEGEQLQSEALLKSDILIIKLENPSVDISNEEESSDIYNKDRSLCNSASNNSLSSFTSSMYPFYSNYNFTRFIGNMEQNQNKQERSSLLKLHSKKLIANQLMKHSLADLAEKCEEERILIEQNLDHLKRLAREFNFDTDDRDNSQDCVPKPLEYDNDNSCSERQNYLIWPPKIIESSDKPHI